MAPVDRAATRTVVLMVHRTMVVHHQPTATSGRGQKEPDDGDLFITTPERYGAVFRRCSPSGSGALPRTRAREIPVIVKPNPADPSRCTRPHVVAIRHVADRTHGVHITLVPTGTPTSGKSNRLNHTDSACQQREADVGDRTGQYPQKSGTLELAEVLSDQVKQDP
ncbi:hypothetical protein GCM10009675_32340 [Prauserella alba]|uniref:Uncharacterized protein n=1 Tax=Prauserella alba TaxID=176898 RepID=A0ABP4G111_9PSEU